MNNYRKYIQGCHGIITTEIVSSFIDKFWNEVMLSFDKKQVIRLIFKVKYSNNSTRSFSQASLLTQNPKFKDKLLSEITGYIQLNSQHYEELEVKNILFEYFVYNPMLSEENYKLLRDSIENEFISKPIEVRENKIIDYSFLPKTMDLWEWSDSINFNERGDYAHFTMKGFNFIFNIYRDSYSCWIKKDNKVYVKFTDTRLSPKLELNNFKRIIYSKNKDKIQVWDIKYEELIYESGVVVADMKRQAETRFLKSYKPKNKK